LWQQVAGVPKDRIFRLGEEDNFWQMGETGPCGPCSEIHYDLGLEAAEPGREGEQFPADGGGRFVEIWNLVFMQFDRDASAKLTPLPRPSIDTGMGLERLTAVMQGVLSNYDTDLLRPIIDRAGELIGKSYGGGTSQDDERSDTILRINADHARATAFLINDGVLPSNEGRGYVLRKIMRRAMRNARMAGASDPYLYKLTGFVAELMRDAYPEMMESVQRVARVVKEEEHRYATTFQVAEKVFYDEAARTTDKTLPGDVAFKLYDTYGLAIEEQQEMATERGMGIDLIGFQMEMEKQRTRARASWKGAEKGQVNPVYQALPKTEFIGREALAAPATVVAVLDGEIALDRTPFYAEAGGQVGDTGVLVSPQTGQTVAVVESAYSAAPGKTVHKVKMLGAVKPDDTVIARVDAPSRLATMRNHTATHLLHAALRTVLGSHVKQAGSVVEPSRLRFDFTHYTAMDPTEIAEVERLVNEEILANREVHTDVMDLDKALSTGAMALFGEKYGEEVRVVSIPDPKGGVFSRELCGGTHVGRTGDIGVFKVVYEGSISAGVRRMEAITGEGALRWFQEAQAQLARVAGMLQVPEIEVENEIESLRAKLVGANYQIKQLKTKLAQSQAGDLEGQARDIKGAKVLAARVDGFDRAQLRTLVDSLRNKWKTAVVVLAAADNSDIAIVSGVTKDLTSKVQAGKLVQQIALGTGGKGGGRPDMAEGGGKNVSALAAELDRVYKTVEEKL
jgi:alanyl-tRNA synthetase